MKASDVYIWELLLTAGVEGRHC
uniref:Uncharacterized protein n=1 Tax=Anguilla anguilla TaxID=7936 RepID=A0A0E9X8W9_ANGAN